MITVNRKTGQVIQMDKLSPEQSQKAWEKIVTEHINRHPEMLKTTK